VQIHVGGPEASDTVPGVVYLIALIGSLIFGGADQVSGPFFGFCGWVWRARRAWVAAALIAGAFTLEPLARWLAGALEPTPLARSAEVLAGLGLAAWIAHTRRSCARAAPRG
jgi:hypothetical protein